MHLITQSCILFLWMHSLTFVESKDCPLRQFVNSRRYDTNFDMSGLQASYPSGKQLRMPCNIGYTGFFKLICADGIWTYHGSRCQPRSCGHPGDAQFADFHLDQGDDFIFGSEVVYTCHRGYQMISRNNRRHCMAEGWDGVVPVCEAVHCPPIRMANNVQVTGDPEHATFGNVVRFSCKNNNEALIGTIEIYCDENGVWSSPPPTCEAIKCFAPDISHGRVRGAITEYNELSILDFECNTGYQKTDERPSTCIKQGTRSEWSPTPMCERIKCKLPEQLAGTTYEGPSQDRFLPGGSVTVKCGREYWVGQQQETAVSTCLDNGKWDIEPLCKEITCTRYDEHVVSWSWHRYYKILRDDTLGYTCQRGYKKPLGVRQARCTRQGWSPNPLCEVKTCRRHNEPNTDIVSVIKPIYNFDEVVVYQCKGGYEGRFELRCGENQWLGRRYCSEKGCGRLDIPHAYITYNSRSTYQPGDWVHYTCTHEQKRLQLNCRYGKWEGLQSCSDSAQCGSPVIPHGFAVKPNNQTKYYYTCNYGYKLITKGWWGEAQCENGKWTGIEECIDNHHCGPVPRIPNMMMTSEQKVYHQSNRVTVTCAKGYAAQLTYLTCSRGKWHHKGLKRQEICKSDTKYCDFPPKVANAVILTSNQKKYPSDFVVTYKCHSNFTLVGENQTKCIEGKWSVVDINCTGKCDRPVDMMQRMNFTEDKETYMNGEVIEYQCIPPSVKSGSNAKCINGKWNATIECKEVTCTKYDPLVVSWDGAREIKLNETLGYRCRTGYETPQGVNRATCTRHGWSPNPLCEASRQTDTDYVGAIY